MDVLVTRSTEGQGLAAKRNHPLDPCRLFMAWILVQVLHRSDMMHLDVVCASTEFTIASEQSVNEF